MIQFVLMLWGLVYLLTTSSIFAGVRMAAMDLHPMLGQLVYCPACSGFWIGGLLSVVSAWPLPPLLWAPLDAAISSTGIMAIASAYIPSGAYDAEQNP